MKILNNIKEMNKKTKQILLITMLLVVILTIGVTYAFFSANIGDPESESTISIGGAEMSISYDDASPAITLSNIYPKDESWIVKTFTLTGTNTADFDMAYQIGLVVDSNTFSDNTLTYTLSSENTSDSGVIAPSITEQVGIPTGTNSIILGEGKFVQKASNKIHTYTFNLFFQSTNDDQNAEQGKSFSAHIVVNPYNAMRDGVKLAMQTVTKDGTITGITNAPITGNYFLKKNCTGAAATYENNTLNATATDVLAYCSLEFKEPYTVEVSWAETPYEKNASSLLLSNSKKYEAKFLKIISHGNNWDDNVNSISTAGYNDNVIISITPIEYYKYNHTECDGTYDSISNIGNEITVTRVKSDMECTIEMEAEQHTITITTPENYTIDSYTETTHHGDSAIINIIPNEGFTYSSATCIGNSGLPFESYNEIEITDVMSDIACTINVDRPLFSKVLGIDNSNVTSPQTTPGRQVSSASEAVLASTPDDYGTSYYYRGAVENNYVDFAGMCWRIVRVTGNRAVKLVLYNYNGSGVANPCESSQDGTTNAFARYNLTKYNSSFNNDFSQNAHVGFMYGTPGSSSYGEEHANINKSTILTNLETWYHAKLAPYSFYLEDTIWCNDKSVVSDTTFDTYGIKPNAFGYGTNVTYYNSELRLRNVYNSNPSLICPNDKNGGKLSKYTAYDVTYGNGDLTYSIGLLTADEVAFAGATYGTANETYYLNKNSSGSSWWLLSPNLYYGSYAGNQMHSNSGSINSYSVGTQFALRPAIALLPNVTATGTGTQTDPYKIVLKPIRILD